MRAAKGAKWERQFAKELSEWWSADYVNGPQTDLFWRTAGSGGRATTRAKTGLTTAGGCGDITSTHESSVAFSEVFALELKRGYNRVTFHDLLDRPKRSKPSVMEQWIKQAQDSATAAKVPFWWLVHKRDAKDAMVYFPVEMTTQWLHAGFDTILPDEPKGRLYYATAEGQWMALIAAKFAPFLASIRPEAVRDYAKSLRPRKPAKKAKAH